MMHKIPICCFRLQDYAKSFPDFLTDKEKVDLEETNYWFAHAHGPKCASIHPSIYPGNIQEIVSENLQVLWLALSPNLWGRGRGLKFPVPGIKFSQKQKLFKILFNCDERKMILDNYLSLQLGGEERGDAEEEANKGVQV